MFKMLIGYLSGLFLLRCHLLTAQHLKLLFPRMDLALQDIQLVLSLFENIFLLLPFFYFLMQPGNTLLPFTEKAAVTCLFILLQPRFQKLHRCFVAIDITAKGIQIVDLGI